MSKINFKELYNATAEGWKLLKQPIVKSRNERAVASAIDSATEQKQQAEESLEDVLKVVGDGKVINVDRVLELRATIKNASETITDLEAFQKEFFS